NGFYNIAFRTPGPANSVAQHFRVAGRHQDADQFEPIQPEIPVRTVLCLDLEMSKEPFFAADLDLFHPHELLGHRSRYLRGRDQPTVTLGSRASQSLGIVLAG